MDLLFCDVCNESVPQKDLDEGTARRRKGRVVCVSCEEAMSSEGPGARQKPETDAGQAQDPIPRGGVVSTGASIVHAHGRVPAQSGFGVGSTALVLALIGLGASAAGGKYLWDNAQESNRNQRSELEQLRAALGASEARSERSNEAELASLGSTLDQLRTEQSSLGNRLERFDREERQRTEGLRADLSTATERLASVEAFRKDLDRIELDVQKVGRFTADLHEQQLRMADRLEGLRDDVGNVRELAAVDLGAILEPAMENSSEAPADVRPAWLDFVGDLRSQSGSVRWQAVQSIGQSGDPAAAEYLAPMLKDPDIFVRMASARNLGDLAAPIGIPALIDALNDAEESVRESAVVSLRVVTKKDYRFDPSGKEAERSRAVKQWRDWWESAKADLLGGK